LETRTLKKWNQLAETHTSDGKAVTLHERDGVYYIRVDGIELMSTRRVSSEERMAELGCSPLKDLPNPSVLIGGLGFGFTLKAALTHLPASAHVVVSEILPAVVSWNSNPAYGLAGAALADKRVKLIERDVLEVMEEHPNGFDTILMDVDNGPAAFSTEGNQRLYEPPGLALAYQALRPGGHLVVWSAEPAHFFERSLTRAGFKVSLERTRAHTTSGGWHVLYIGQKN
jgi:spermidine synthase